MKRFSTERSSARRARALLAALLLATTSCHKADELPAGETQARVAGKTIVVTPQRFTETLKAIGTVTPRVGHIAVLSAPAPGRVGQVLVAMGRAVRVGDPLIELDQAPFRATLDAAQAAYHAAQQASERQQRLANEGIAPRKDAEQAVADLARARNELDVAQRAQSLSVIKAPIAGVVTRVVATIGSSVDPSQPLIEISDPTMLDVVLSVTPADAGRVRRGDKTTLAAGQSPDGEALGAGTVVDIAGTIDSATRSIPVRVQAAATRRRLRIGETVFGSIAIASRASAIVIPIEALVLDGEAYQVFVVDANSIAHSRPVTVGGKTSTMAEITSGLSAGERIVTFGAFGMQDSAKVVPLPPLGDSAKTGTP
jgi:membrane fusion protein, heavy metal efflux system